MSKLKKLFGRKIREFRKEHKMTQANLAEAVSVDDKHISCIEAGKNFPSPDLIERLAGALNVDIKDLFEFSYLEDPMDLKKDILDMVERLENNELSLAYKYIRTFLLK